MPDKIGASGFTAEEEASLEGDDDAIETEVDPEGEIEVDPEPAPREQKPAAPSGKPPPGFVPQESLHESRQRTKEATARADRLEETFRRLMERGAPKQPDPAEAIPDFNTDPVGNLTARLEIAERAQRDASRNQAERQQHEEQNGRTQEMLNRYATSVRVFSKEAPDFEQAYQYLSDSRDKELQALGFDDPVDRTNRLQYEEGLIVGRALHSGKDPAKLLYDYAVTRGFKAPAPAGQQQESRLDRLVKGSAAAKSLAGSKGGGDDVLTLERLAELDGAAFDQAWEKMRRKGALG